MPEFVTAAEVKAWLRDTDVDDALLDILIPAASEAVEGYCQREFTPTPAEEREFFYPGGGVLSFAPYEARSISALTVAVEAQSPVFNPLVAGRDYGLRGRTRQGTYLWMTLPRYAIPTFDPLPGPAVGWTVKITGDWGMTSVPQGVKTATLIVIEGQLATPAGDSTSDEVGGISVEQGEGASSHIPPDAKGWLEDFVRASGVGV